MYDDKKPNSVLIRTHDLVTKGMQRVHHDYGLKVTGYCGGGHPQSNSYYICPWRYFEFFVISHLRDGAGRLSLDSGKEFDLNVGDAVIMCPKDVHRYGGYHGKPYIEDSLNFYGPVAEMLQKAGVIQTGVCHLGSEDRLKEIVNFAREPDFSSQIYANIALQQLCVDIYKQNREINTVHSKIDELIVVIKNQLSHWWTVAEMAEFCSISDDQLRRRFLKHTGMLPKDYVDRLKIQHACQLLLSKKMKINEISDSLGYLDCYHFSRRFKQLMGVSPANYMDIH